MLPAPPAPLLAHLGGIAAQSIQQCFSRAKATGRFPQLHIAPGSPLLRLAPGFKRLALTLPQHLKLDAESGQSLLDAGHKMGDWVAEVYRLFRETRASRP